MPGWRSCRGSGAIRGRVASAGGDLGGVGVVVVGRVEGSGGAGGSRLPRATRTDWGVGGVVGLESELGWGSGEAFGVGFGGVGVGRFVVVDCRADEVLVGGVFEVTRGVSVTESVLARRGEFRERGGRSDSERLSLMGVELALGAGGSALSVGLRRNAAPTIPISRMASASPTCVSRFMVMVSGRPGCHGSGGVASIGPCTIIAHVDVMGGRRSIWSRDVVTTAGAVIG